MKTALHFLVAALFVTGASAQSFVYPAKGQSPQQQKQDESQCHTWAVQQSKYDPANPPAAAQTAQQPTTATGATRGSGARGAARGAVVGGVVGDDDGARTGAAAGAVAGRAQSRRQNQAQAQQQQQASSQQDQAGLSAYNRARAACLEGRGYTVK